MKPLPSSSMPLPAISPGLVQMLASMSGWVKSMPVSITATTMPSPRTCPRPAPRPCWRGRTAPNSAGRWGRTPPRRACPPRRRRRRDRPPATRSPGRSRRAACCPGRGRSSPPRSGAAAPAGARAARAANRCRVAPASCASDSARCALTRVRAGIQRRGAAHAVARDQRGDRGLGCGGRGDVDAAARRTGGGGEAALQRSPELDDESRGNRRRGRRCRSRPCAPAWARPPPRAARSARAAAPAPDRRPHPLR